MQNSNMLFKIKAKDYQNMMKLALLPNESEFLIRAKRNRDILEYFDTPIILQGDKTSCPNMIEDKDFEKIKVESREKDYFLIDAHTHPEESGKIILPYSCGWSIPRNEEMRDYRNKNLETTEMGFRALAERKRILGEMLKLEQDKRSYLENALIELSPETSTANLVKIKGIDCYITNSINSSNNQDIIKDISPNEGDLCNNMIFFLKEVLGMDATALIKPYPIHVFQPSSVEKYALEILQMKSGKIDDVEKINIKIVN